MNSSSSQPLALGFLKGIARKIAAVLAECNNAQRRMAVLRTAPDWHAFRPDTAPDTYAEFLFRTSGVLLHEPSAGARQHGAALR
jgi:hypothetical protein